MRFRKKPVVIDAMQFTGDNGPEVMAWAGGAVALGLGSLHILTLEGEMRANPGDWIIRGVKGEFYPCRADIFEATYEPTGDH